VKEWIENLPGYRPIRMKQYKFRGTIDDFRDAVESLSPWRSPTTGEQVGFVPLDPDPAVKNYVPRPTQAAWLARMFPIPSSTRLATIGVNELRALGQTQLTFTDGFLARMRGATSMGIVFDEIIEALRELLPDVDEPNPHASATEAIKSKAGRKTDRFYDQAFEMIQKGTPQADARQWFFEQSKIKSDTGAIKAFNVAMRRRKATK
jgi:hypothetical protein